VAFDVDRFRVQAERRKSALGRPLSYRPVTGSTNDDALLAARSGAPHGSVFLADEQTAGRGRRGHTWLSTPGESLLFSVLVRPKLELAEVSALTLAIGLALRDAVLPLISAPLAIKWPNDLLVNRQKLAGVLVESQLQGTDLQALVIGVGLNVTTRQFPAEIAATATSLALLGATLLAREPLLLDLLDAIDRRLSAYQTSGVAGILAELNAADALRGARVRVGDATGIGRGLDEQGRLLIEGDDQRLSAMLSGTVELL
jgi:BirA family biotin operon repressor/biotin-[acetyl-CoA-carboxylase] ligase